MLQRSFEHSTLNFKKEEIIMTTVLILAAFIPPIIGLIIILSR